MITIVKTIPVRFYTENSGKEPVREWLKKLEKNDKKRVGEDIKSVQLRWPLGMPLVRSFGDGIWEIRSTLDNRIARIFFVMKDGYIVLLHAFIKKTQKTPTTELAIVKKRAKSLL